MESPTSSVSSGRGATAMRAEGAMLEIDESMQSHLEAFVAQCLTQATIKDVPTWSTLLLAAVRQLLDSVTQHDLERVTESKFALLSPPPKSQSRKKGNADKEREGDTVKLDRTAVASTSDSHYLAARRRLATNRNTAHTPNEPPDNSPVAVSPGEPTPDPKLSIYHLAVEVEELSLSELANSTATLSLSFLANEWTDTSTPIFGKYYPFFPNEVEYEHVDRLGGTFKIVCTPAQRPKLLKVLELVAYVALSLTLEIQLRSDSQCVPLDDHPSPPEEPTPMQETTADADEFEDQSSSLRSSATIKSSSRNLWGVFGTKSSRNLSLSHSKTLPVSSAPNPTPTPSAFTSFTSTFNKSRFRNPLKLRRTRFERVQGSSNALERIQTIATDWDLIGEIGLSSSAELSRDPPPIVPPSVSKSDASALKVEGEKVQESPGEKIETIIGKMRTAILSSSPGVIYPPPSLLVRLRLEELSKPTCAKSSTAQALVGRFAGSSESANEEPVISIDDRSQISSLIQNNNSLRAVVIHQSLSFLYDIVLTSDPTSHSHKSSPRLISNAFFDFHTFDKPLRWLIESLVDARDEKCESAGCDAKRSDHSVLFMHNAEKLQISLRPLPSASTSTTTSPLRQITMRTTCGVCDASTAPVEMSAATSLFSFSKYFELILYDPHFVPPICDHSAGAMLRTFELDGVVLEIRVSRIECYEISSSIDSSAPPITNDEPVSEAESVSSTHDFGGASLAREDEPSSVIAIALSKTLFESDSTLSPYLPSAAPFRRLPIPYFSPDPSTASPPASRADLRFHVQPKFVQKSNNLLSVRIPTTPDFFKRSSSTTSSRMDLVERVPSSDAVLDDLLKKKKEIDLSKAPPRAVPSVMATVTKRHVSEPTTTSTLSTAEILSRRDRTKPEEGDSTFSSTHSEVPTPLVSSSASSFVDHGVPDVSVGSTASKLMSSLWNLPSSIRSAASFGSAAPDSTTTQHQKYKFSNLSVAFAVTAYYEKEFQEYRHRCGITEADYLASLSRCRLEKTTGGKSGASFYRTRDRKYFLKESLTNWTGGERESFLAFVPMLLEHLKEEQPTFIARPVGFYTLKMKKNGTSVKRDFVVLENLFANFPITSQYDLKGITSRFAKEPVGTKLDGDWINGASQILIYSHSKALIKCALARDVAFLSAAGLLDYSILVGVDETTKRIRIGLIDCFGFYNLIKLFETTSKTTLKKLRGSDDTVTVIPPADYAERFLTATEAYFIDVPEKWTRPQSMDESARLACPL